MIYLDQTYELLTGGYYLGNKSWNKTHSEIDNCFKLYQLTEGEAVICDETNMFQLRKNELYFINGNKLSKQYCLDNFSTYWIHFIPKDLIIYQGLVSLPLVVRLPVNNYDMAESISLLESLLFKKDLSNSHYTLSVLHLQNFLQRVTIELFSQYPLKNQYLSIETQRIEPAIKFINKNYKETIRLETLARLCNMSLNYFHKLFKQTLNITPANYQILLRMNAALQMLANKEMTIKNIAYELGFTDNAHFCKSFKMRYGITPSEYQKKRHENLF